MIFSPQQHHLLSPVARNHESLQGLVAMATRLILLPYQQDGEVMLRGWDPDEPDVDLLEALQLAIAQVINHLAEAPHASLQSSTRGARSESYRKHQMTPPGVYRLLDPFDTLRAPVWRV